ncbi:MAG: hypothetical protein ACPG6V_02665, partial [Flavobacteriales bacterium]
NCQLMSDVFLGNLADKHNNKNKLRNIFKILVFMTFPLLQNCATIQLTDRVDKDIYLNTSDYMKLKGTYTDSTIVNYSKKSTDTIGYIYAPCKVDIMALSPKRLEYSYFINDSLVDSKILKGKFSDGYFMQRSKFGVKFSFGPLLWGPGSEKYAYGITTENNLIITEAHGGVAIFIVLPFFAGGGNSEHEYKRIDNK